MKDSEGNNDICNGEERLERAMAHAKKAVVEKALTATF